ncbi:MAG: 4Fe-4S dicluster domain-containing protein [Deltaproteobacteria bacterium]|nr:4Fe-4S dicluster domain-containing protein [Deltaproteobacteria bacterium]
MFIDANLCKRCLKCKSVCPMGAIDLEYSDDPADSPFSFGTSMPVRIDSQVLFINIHSKKMTIDYEMCVECGVCLRLGICPEEAIKQVEEIPYPRIIRAVFSNPTQPHPSTGIGGRGTEEMKTNDVTNLFTKGKIGFSIELGRPGVGAYLIDLDRVVRKVTSMGVQFAEDNPVIPLIADRTTGALKPELLEEKVMSAIAEFLVPEENIFQFIKEIKQFLNSELDSVATMSVIARADDDGRCEFLERLKEQGETPYPNGKVNIGMALVRNEVAP